MIAVPRKRRYRTLKQKLSRFILSMAGWKVVGSKPDLPKYVMIGYPHTSNWDFPIGLLIMTALGFELHWIGKSSLFRWPMGWLLRKLGGVPINRSTSQNFVEQAVTAFREHEKMTLVIAPEGTRSKVEFWRSGFYYIAWGAVVPVIPGFVDYSKKTGGTGPAIFLTGNIEHDLQQFREFYKGKIGKYPEKTGEIRFKQEARS